MSTENGRPTYTEHQIFINGTYIIRSIDMPHARISSDMDSLSVSIILSMLNGSFLIRTHIECINLEAPIRMIYSKHY